MNVEVHGSNVVEKKLSNQFDDFHCHYDITIIYIFYLISSYLILV